LIAPVLALALHACEKGQEVISEPPTESGISAGAARVSGRVQSVNGPVRIHVFEGADLSKPSRVVSSDAQGGFQVDVEPGSVVLFVEKDGQKASQVRFEELKAGTEASLDTVRLADVLQGVVALPGLADLSISARVEGSPLSVTRDPNGGFVVKAVSGGESILVLSYVPPSGAKTELRFRIRSVGGSLRVERQETADPLPPVVSPIQGSLVLRPAPDEVQETEVLGDFTGTSTWRMHNFGGRPAEGLGGAYDGNTIGRHLWRWEFPDSLKSKRIVSARIVFVPLQWGNRPTGGQDLTIEAYRMLRPWLEGKATGQGSPVTADFDGASGTGPRFGQSWSMPLVGLDGIDAETVPLDRRTLPYLSKENMSFDITAAVRGWLENPSTNHGLLFRSVHESDGTYLDYPSFGVDDHPDATKRPFLVLELGEVTEEGGSLAVLQPGPEGQDDAMIIGTFTGNGSHDGNNQGTVNPEGLGGAWDANTVGRLLWRIQLPDSLRGKTIVSAKAVFQVNSWLGRPVSGHDLRIDAHRLLKAWKEGQGAFPGERNSVDIDGATSLGPSFGSSWNRPLVGLDGVDAQARPSARSVLAYGSTAPMEFDLTELARIWQADPSTNHGVVFRSLEETHPDYPDYPGFHMSEATDPTLRPKLVVRYR